MTTPTGAIGLSDVNVELGRPYNQNINMNDGAVRNLAGLPSGYVDMWNLRGKSSYIAMTAQGHGGSSTGVVYPTQKTSFTVSANISVDVQNGSGGYSFTWSIQSGPGTIADIHAQSTSISTTASRTGIIATTYCSVTIADNTGHQITVSNIEVDWDWESTQ